MRFIRLRCMILWRRGILVIVRLRRIVVRLLSGVMVIRLLCALRICICSDRLRLCLLSIWRARSTVVLSRRCRGLVVLRSALGWFDTALVWDGLPPLLRTGRVAPVRYERAEEA